MITPARQQYLRLKAEQPEALLLYRMGDFYEMFDEDAHLAARVLGITLTSREFGRGQRVPMAGVPHHALNGYLRRLLRAGLRVAISEQLSEPGHGLVEREIVRVLSPGTVDDPALLDAQRPNYLLAIARHGLLAGLCWVDVSTGAFEFTAFALDDPAPLMAFIQQLAAAEIVAPVADELPQQIAARRLSHAWHDDDADAIVRGRFADSEPLRPAVTRAVATLIRYLEDGHATLLRAIEPPSPFVSDGVMVLDRQTRLNLELDLRERDRVDLFGLLNRTRSAPGARRLRGWLDRPLTARTTLEERHDAVAELLANPPLRARLAKLLGATLDLERLATRVATGGARATELLALSATLATAAEARALLLMGARSRLLTQSAHDIDTVDEARALIDCSVGDTHARAVRVERDKRLAALQATIDAEREAIAALEALERDRTGVRTLKIGYNKVAGYYFEVSRAKRAILPPDFERKQQLTNAERYVTPTLLAGERRLLAAEERLAALESDLYVALLAELGVYVRRLRATAGALATIDVLQALATVAAEQRYTRPQLREEPGIQIRAGRHALVERGLPPGEFVPNDTDLSEQAGRVTILTGPNMAGKSTYLRQVALIVLLAQIGSFVPADDARIGLVDRIFTRLGAHDDLSHGQSTFMVEMLETATILNHASDRSLVLLDEIGRGTGTEDGLAIATAVVEHLTDGVGALTLFATHFRELADLAERHADVRAFQTAVARHDGQLVFLHAIIPGVADSAFGIEIAQLAGVPTQVIERARAAVVDPGTRQLTVKAPAGVTEQPCGGSCRRGARAGTAPVHRPGVDDAAGGAQPVGRLPATAARGAERTARTACAGG